jgi:GNAT superfamily N-acetyltransferase
MASLLLRCTTQDLSGRSMIRELYPHERALALELLLGMDAEDRHRRFGRAMSDEGIRAYVARMDWDETTVLGAFDAHARVIGILELTDLPHGSCEIAVVVAPAQRGRGVGLALMHRALLKARVHGRERVMLLCQADNEPMRRLARSAGLSARAADGEVEGRMDLSDARLADVAEDLTRDAMGNAAYASLLATRTWAELFENALRASAHRPEAAAAA